MCGYPTIDLALAEWAEMNSFHWYSEYQDTEVRSLVLNPQSKSPVQIAVDVPKSGHTVIHVWQVPGGLSRLARTVKLPTLVTNISDALDRALETANEWLAEVERTGR